MKLTKLLFIALLAITIGACGGAATEQKTDDAKDASNTEKKDDAKTEDAEKKETADAGDDSPTQAIKDFVNAYKEKDVEGFKKRLTKSSLETMEKGAKLQKKELDDQIKAMMELNNMPFKDVPEMRNEKIDGDKATVEVNADGNWESTPLVKENGIWKLDLTNMKK